MYEVSTLLVRTGPKRAGRRTSSNGWRAALSQGPASEHHRPHAASARARVAVPALSALLLLVPHKDAYQCVRTCRGARGWGEATHASERGAAARKSQRATRIAGVEKFVGSRFTPTCNESATRVRLSHNVRAHTATLAAVRPVDRLTRGQIQSRAFQIWLISELLLLMHACAVRWPVSGPPSLSLSLSLSLSPDYALLERLFERALARASACASLHIEGLPAAGAA